MIGTKNFLVEFIGDVRVAMAIAADILVVVIDKGASRMGVFVHDLQMLTGFLAHWFPG